MSEPEYDELESEDTDMTAGLSLVDQMIVDTAREVGASTVRKWVVSTPASRNLKLEPKRKREASSSRRHAPAKTKASSSKKRKVVVVSDSDDEDPAISITVYVLIPKKAPSIVSKPRGKPPPSEILQKGPFDILSTDSYPQFLSKLAAALPCLPKHIHESKIEWKPKKPLNAPTLTLGKAAGYKAMLSEMVAKKADTRTVLLSMPPPAEPMEEETPWATGSAEEGEKKVFDYSELESTTISNSLQEQQMSFNKATKDERALLEEKYPIGNYPNIDADKRIYRDPKTGFYFELNNSRVGVWCSAMAQKLTTWETPPINSRFFDAKQRMKVPGADAPPPPAPVIAPPAAVPAPIAPAASTSLTDILLATLLAGGGGGGALAAFFPQSHLAAPPVVQPRSAPPSPVKPHTVTLEQFCELYNIDAIDCARLMELGFRPGDTTEPKPDDEVKQVGFALFSWRRIHEANVRFKAELAGGKFV
ncbi:hypothetical protein B0H16DRAFT_1579863 [Mycena metata]|uniref:Uncharacterized protein n=1 Tax=Mycena metata TaxID=1033252 RepID=A0AAD7I288_9AGAR|nr:hypothetical protein B0H16DRAFT_1579863 [Mycena metata]